MYGMIAIMIFLFRTWSKGTFDDTIFGVFFIVNMSLVVLILIAILEILSPLRLSSSQIVLLLKKCRRCRDYWNIEKTTRNFM